MRLKRIPNIPSGVFQIHPYVFEEISSNLLMNGVCIPKLQLNYLRSGNYEFERGETV